MAERCVEATMCATIKNTTAAAAKKPMTMEKVKRKLLSRIFTQCFVRKVAVTAARAIARARQRRLLKLESGDYKRKGTIAETMGCFQPVGTGEDWRARQDYSGHPALRPCGARLTAVQIRSRRI